MEVGVVLPLIPVLSHIFRPWITLAAQAPDLLTARQRHCWAQSTICLTEEMDQVLPVSAKVIPILYVHSTTGFVSPDIRKSKLVGIEVGIELLCPFIDARDPIDELVELCNDWLAQFAHASQAFAIWLAEFELIGVIALPVKSCVYALSQLLEGHSCRDAEDASDCARTCFDQGVRKQAHLDKVTSVIFSRDMGSLLRFFDQDGGAFFVVCGWSAEPPAHE
jgi:hypothetical protein